MRILAVGEIPVGIMLVVTFVGIGLVLSRRPLMVLGQNVGALRNRWYIRKAVELFISILNFIHVTTRLMNVHEWLMMGGLMAASCIHPHGRQPVDGVLALGLPRGINGLDRIYDNILVAEMASVRLFLLIPIVVLKEPHPNGCYEFEGDLSVYLSRPCIVSTNLGGR